MRGQSAVLGVAQYDRGGHEGYLDAGSAIAPAEAAREPAELVVAHSSSNARRHSGSDRPSIATILSSRTAKAIVVLLTIAKK
jgi:hypothetical protein